MSLQRALLLDFDGVVVKNKRVQNYVGHACTQFFAKKTGLSYNKAKKLNQQLYPLYGHSSLALQKKLNIPCSIQDFNKGVYCDLIDYAVVKRLLCRDDFTYARALATLVGSFYDPCQTYIFSNAPDVWCIFLLRTLGIEYLVTEKKGFLCSNTFNCIKPMPEMYARAAAATQLRQPNLQHIMFVDDSLINFAPIMNESQWSTVHYLPGKGANLDQLKNSLMYELSSL